MPLGPRDWPWGAPCAGSGGETDLANSLPTVGSWATGALGERLVARGRDEQGRQGGSADMALALVMEGPSGRPRDPSVAVLLPEADAGTLLWTSDEFDTGGFKGLLKLDECLRTTRRNSFVLLQSFDCPRGQAGPPSSLRC